MNEMKRERLYYRCILGFGCIILGFMIAKGMWGTKQAVWRTSEQLGNRMAFLYGENEEEYMKKYVSLVEMLKERVDELNEPENRVESVEDWVSVVQKEFEREQRFEGVHFDLVVDGVLYTDMDCEIPENYDFTKDRWYIDALESNGEVVFSDVYISKFVNEKVVTIAQIDPDTGNGVAVDIYKSYMEKLSSAQEILEGESYFLCDSKGNLIYSNTEEECSRKELNNYARKLYQKIQSGSETAKIFGEKVVRIYSYENSNGWNSIVAMPESILMQNVASIRNSYIAIAVGFILFLLICFGIIHYSTKLDISASAVDALGEIYFQTYYISLEDKTYMVYKDCGEDNKKVRKLKKDAGTIMKEQICKVVSEVDQLRVLRFVDLDTLASRLVGVKSLSCEFVRKDIGWCKAYFIPLKKNKNGRVLQVLYIISCIEEEKKKEEKMLAERNDLADIISATSRMFDRFCIVDFKEDRYVYSYMKNRDLYNRKGFTEKGVYSEFVREIASKFNHPDYPERTMEKEFSVEEIQNALSPGVDMVYLELIDSLCNNCYLGVTMYCLARQNERVTKVLFATRDLTTEKEEEFKNRQEMKATNKALEDMAMHDQLTGLYNRNGLQKIGEELKREKRPVGIMILDIDFFKQVNDTWGHKMGDRILVHVANTLKQSFRKSDIVVRLGGDEFLIILRNYQRGESDFVIEKINKINEKLKNPEEDFPPVSLSVGVAFSDTAREEELYLQADEALYAVKENGRCGCAIYGRKVAV